MATPQPLTGLKNIAPYVAGESELTGFDRVIKLASNEGALGPSKNVLEALASSSHDFYRYPDGDCTELRELLANKNSLTKDSTIIFVLSFEQSLIITILFTFFGIELIVFFFFSSSLYAGTITAIFFIILFFSLNYFRTLF